MRLGCLFSVDAGNSASFRADFSDSFAGFGSSDGQPIEIESNELKVEDQTKVATFIGDVVVIQGDTRLETSQLKVFYDGDGQSSEGADTSNGAVQLNRRSRGLRQVAVFISPPRTRPRPAMLQTSI